MKNIITTTIIGLLAMASVYGQRTDVQFKISPDFERQGYVMTYQAANISDVQVKLRDESGTVIFRETLEDASQLARFYRMEEVASGNYQFEITTPDGSFSESVEYPVLPTNEWTFQLLKDPNSDRYQLVLDASPEEVVEVNIYDDNNNLLYSRSATVEEHNNQVYNLTKVPSDAVTLTVSDQFRASEKVISLQ